jgi:tryptophan synthase alpha chain
MESTSVTTSYSGSTRSLGSVFDQCRAEGRAALILYVTAGHPSPELGLEVLTALADAGADIIELGVPFSDPLADGPTIQKSSFDAIANGVTMATTLDLLARFRAVRQTPVVVFSYLNPVVRYGVDRFIDDATRAGASGVLLTDLPAGADPEVEKRFLTPRWISCGWSRLRARPIDWRRSPGARAGSSTTSLVRV